jgi:hypothetical protein
MTPEFAGREDNVEKLGAVEIIQVLRRVFNLVRVPRGFVDETANRLRIGGA